MLRDDDTDTRFLDKEYRKGVHWLETLRLRRVKILQAGYNVRMLVR